MMESLDILAAHVPDMRQGRGRIAGMLALACFALTTAGLLLVDRSWPAWSGLGQFAVVGLGFVLVSQFFWRRKEFQARWGERAYRNAFACYVLTGLPVMFAAIAHNSYLPGTRLLSGWAAWILVIPSLYFLLTGLALWVRGVLTFGFDNLAMLYVYFPAEGRLVESSIYALIRHPVYSAVIRIGLALGLWRGTWFSIAFGLFMPLGLSIWLRLVEEPELIERFGEGYAKYRRSTPAFWLPPWDARKFLRFLVIGK